MSQSNNIQTIERTIREVYKFKDENVFYSFKYEYSETNTDKGKSKFLRQQGGNYMPISCIVIFGGTEDSRNSKKLYFSFHPDLKSNSTMGSLILSPKSGTHEPKKIANHRHFRPDPEHPYENAAYPAYQAEHEREADIQNMDFALSENVTYSKPLKFDSIEESTRFATILQKVHNECIRIMMKFKDQSTIPHTSVQSFFEKE